LRGPLARLALEHAAIGRRYGVAREQTQRTAVNRGLNQTVTASLLGGLAHDEDEAKTNSMGRWLRELTPEQQLGFDQIQPGRPPTTAPTPAATQHPDGPEPPRWVWINNRRYTIGKPRSRVSWRLLAFFWNRDSATYEELQGSTPSGPGEPEKPWPDPVSDSAIATAINRFNTEMPAALSWRLTTQGRCVLKKSRENPAM
jgi:hypothetical protein